MRKLKQIGILEGNAHIDSDKGITLVALVITIIVLLILASITIGLTIGKSGILKQVEYAEKEYVNAQTNEIRTLDELYSSIRVAGDSTVTISMKELDEYINEKIANTSKKDFTEVELWSGEMASSTGEIELTDDYTNYKYLRIIYGDTPDLGIARTSWEIPQSSIQNVIKNEKTYAIYWYGTRYICFGFLEDTKKINVAENSGTGLFQIIGLK